MRRSAAAVVLATLVALLATTARPATAVAPAAVTYRPPVDAPVVDPFRAPSPENWNAGNRGLEYATVPGTPIGAAAGGEVVFAGPVAGGLHVVVLHDDGLRTSYSFLRDISVRRGEKVRQGQTLGTAQDRFHFGARAGDAYLDPAKLFGGPPEVHLVPDELRRPQSEAQERSRLARFLGGLASVARAGGAAAYGWAREKAAAEISDGFDQLRGAIHYATEADPRTHAVRFATAARDWWEARETCTPADVAVPKFQERRMAVMVAGLGSKSTGDSIDAVDTRGLGYAGTDVHHFSYLGGTREETAYAPNDTTQDIHQSAKHLRQLLERLQARHPGVPIDIIAHSQGGIVARTALTDEVDGADPRLPAVKSLVTLSSPHQGAPVATALTMLAHTDVGSDLQSEIHRLMPERVDPQGTSVTQLAAHSEFMRKLDARPLPPGVNVTSIGAREDWMVPAGVTRLEGARNVTVSAPGYRTEHSDMPAGPETHREIALGLAGMEPTCQRFGDALADHVVSEGVRHLENSAGIRAWLLGRKVDRKVDKTLDQIAERIPVPATASRSEP